MPLADREGNKLKHADRSWLLTSPNAPARRQLEDGMSQRGRPGQLASPPPSPLLPAVSEEELRSGFKLDFVKQFRLDSTPDRDAPDEDHDEDKATGRLNSSDSIQLSREDGPNHTAIENDNPENGSLKAKVLKLSPKRLYDFASSPDSLPIDSSFDPSRSIADSPNGTSAETISQAKQTGHDLDSLLNRNEHSERKDRSFSVANGSVKENEKLLKSHYIGSDDTIRPSGSGRTISSPLLKHRANTRGSNSKPPSKATRDVPPALKFEEGELSDRNHVWEGSAPSPMPQSIPVPPLSMPTYLQLELSSERPSPLYIHRSITSDFPYESSRVKIERLKNFMLLPPQLELILWFGALACMDAWLSAFTILPLRFIKALGILIHSWSRNLLNESRDILRFIYRGSGRMWERHRRGSKADSERAHRPSEKASSSRFSDRNVDQVSSSQASRTRKPMFSKHSRTKSTPSALLPDHKADILRGLLILISCNILMYFDASRMYHGIRGQAAIKLYVIYNVLEVCDRLFSALGQDVLECLFSKEALERKADGRSKVLRPFWLFILALAYNLVHSTALFYQVITLNVAVNSYSNALLTLLMSNQFVEIKSTVFKKFEKENLFQLTCADVVERFQLWLMLMIIASRNVVETGGLSIGFLSWPSGDDVSSAASASILPRSFTLFPSWTGQVLAPFFLVLGSEMLVDWLKHAYINKFNNTKPAIYGRFLDVLAKDYYSNAFADQNLTRRLGLPVIPLACLFIRASVQTYHMFLATYLPPPLPSTATSLSVDSATTSAATTEALAHIDNVFRRALHGPSSYDMYPHPYQILDFLLPYLLPLTTILLLFLFLLSAKILLGMALLSFARSRYQGMKKRESESIDAGGRRIGGWGTVEVDEDKRRWIYADDPEGVKRVRERESRDRERAVQGQGHEFSKVERYSMIAKRIW